MAQEAIQYEDIIRQDPGFAAAVTEEDGVDEDGKEVYMHEGSVREEGYAVDISHPGDTGIYYFE